MNASGLRIEYTWGAGTPDEVAPKDGDIILIKRRVSCFAGTDLELILRAQAVQEIACWGAQRISLSKQPRGTKLTSASR